MGCFYANINFGAISGPHKALNVCSHFESLRGIHGFRWNGFFCEFGGRNGRLGRNICCGGIRGRKNGGGSRIRGIGP